MHSRQCLLHVDGHVGSRCTSYLVLMNTRHELGVQRMTGNPRLGRTRVRGRISGIALACEPAGDRVPVGVRTVGRLIRFVLHDL